MNERQTREYLKETLEDIWNHVFHYFDADIDVQWGGEDSGKLAQAACDAMEPILREKLGLPESD